MSKFLVAYATLLSLRNNVKNSGLGIEEKYVYEYHKCLESIESSLRKDQFDSSDFEIPSEQVNPYISEINYLTHETETTDIKYCDEPLFFTKLDAALEYLRLMAPPAEKKQMGFNQGD